MILLGVAGFIIIHLFDFVALKEMRLVKPVIWTAGCVILSYAAFRSCLNPVRYSTPAWVHVCGWIMFPIALAFLTYTLFGSLPFKSTYLDKGVGSELVKTGLYGIVRHPGIYGFAGVMLSLFLLSTSKLMALAGLTWLTIDIILVIFQDIAVFGRMFPGYARYKKETPMLIPTWQSLARYASEFKLKDINTRREIS